MQYFLGELPRIIFHHMLKGFAGRFKKAFAIFSVQNIYGGFSNI